VTTQVIELFVPSNRLEAARSDAEALPAIIINKVGVVIILHIAMVTITVGHAVGTGVV